MILQNARTAAKTRRRYESVREGSHWPVTGKRYAKMKVWDMNNAVSCGTACCAQHFYHWRRLPGKLRHDLLSYCNWRGRELSKFGVPIVSVSTSGTNSRVSTSTHGITKIPYELSYNPLWTVFTRWRRFPSTPIVDIYCRVSHCTRSLGLWISNRIVFQWQSFLITFLTVILLSLLMGYQNCLMQFGESILVIMGESK